MSWAQSRNRIADPDSSAPASIKSSLKPAAQSHAQEAGPWSPLKLPPANFNPPIPQSLSAQDQRVTIAHPVDPRPTILDTRLSTPQLFFLPRARPRQDRPLSRPVNLWTHATDVFPERQASPPSQSLPTASCTSPTAETHPLAHPSHLPNMTGSEPFPLLNTANDQHSSSRDTNGSAVRRRKSSGLGGELRGDTGAPSLGTSFAHMHAASGQHIRVSKRLQSRT